MKSKMKAIIDAGLMTQEEIEKAIKAKIESGDAKNENSALVKVYRDASIIDDGEAEVSGLWLQAYQRNDETVSGYLLTSEGVLRIGNLQECPQPEKPYELFCPLVFSKVMKKKNAFTGSSWFEAVKATRAKKTKLDYALADACQEISDIEHGGMYCIHGFVRYINTVGEFKDGEKVADLPILDNDKVNLRMTIEDGDGNQLRVKIPDEVRLGMLLDEEDFSWLNEPDAEKELADMFLEEPVIVFGAGSKFFGEGRKDERELEVPFINITNYGFVVLNPGEGA